MALIVHQVALEMVTEIKPLIDRIAGTTAHSLNRSAGRRPACRSTSAREPTAGEAIKRRGFKTLPHPRRKHVQLYKSRSLGDISKPLNASPSMPSSTAFSLCSGV
jgi:hypothetical protein